MSIVALIYAFFGWMPPFMLVTFIGVIAFSMLVYVLKLIKLILDAIPFV